MENWPGRTAGGSPEPSREYCSGLFPALKVLVLCYEWPPVGGGGGRVAEQIARGLARRGHEIHAMVAGIGRTTGTVVEEGVHVHRLRCPRSLPDTCPVHEMAAYLLWALIPALRLHRRVRFDAIHAHFAVPTGALAWAVSVATGVPYVLTAHLGDVPGGVPGQTDSLFRWVMPFTRPIWSKAAACTAVSAFVAGLGMSAYHREVSVIPNGVGRIPLSEPPPAKSPVRLLFAGRLSQQKNVPLALRALAQLPDIEWRLDVVGDGPFRAEAEAIAASAIPPGRVRFHGWLAPEPLSDIRAQSQILLMTSHSEGLPMIAVEALFDGLAIVSTDIPGMRDVLVHERNGLAVPPSPEALAEAVRRFAMHPDFLQSARRASLEMAPGFQLERILDAYEGALRKCMKGFKAPTV